MVFNIGCHCGYIRSSSFCVLFITDGHMESLSGRFALWVRYIHTYKPHSNNSSCKPTYVLMIIHFIVLHEYYCVSTEFLQVFVLM